MPLDRLSPQDIPTLLEAGLLTELRVTPAPADQVLPPEAFTTSHWLDLKKTKVSARFVDIEVRASFDPQKIGSASSSLLNRIVAQASDKAPPMPQPSEQDLIHEALAGALTEVLPQISNHARLRIEALLRKPS